MRISRQLKGCGNERENKTNQLTKPWPAVVALTSSGAIYSIVPQNEKARYVCKKVHAQKNCKWHMHMTAPCTKFFKYWVTNSSDTNYTRSKSDLGHKCQSISLSKVKPNASLSAIFSTYLPAEQLIISKTMSHTFQNTEEITHTIKIRCTLSDARNSLLKPKSVSTMCPSESSSMFSSLMSRYIMPSWNT